MRGEQPGFVFWAHRPSSVAPQLSSTSVVCTSQRCSARFECSLAVETALPRSFACLGCCSVITLTSFQARTNTGYWLQGCVCAWVSVYVKCIDLSLFCCLCFVFVLFFNPSSCGHRMTQIGNTISGVTGLRSVWWTLVTLSPSLLTPGSKCMHGRSEIKAKITTFIFMGWTESFSSPLCFHLDPSTLTPNHIALLSPCTQSRQLQRSLQWELALFQILT